MTGTLDNRFYIIDIESGNILKEFDMSKNLYFQSPHIKVGFFDAIKGHFYLALSFRNDSILLNKFSADDFKILHQVMIIRDSFYLQNNVIGINHERNGLYLVSAKHTYKFNLHDLFMQYKKPIPSCHSYSSVFHSESEIILTCYSPDKPSRLIFFNESIGGNGEFREVDLGIMIPKSIVHLEKWNVVLVPNNQMDDLSESLITLFIGDHKHIFSLGYYGLSQIGISNGKSHALFTFKNLGVLVQYKENRLHVNDVSNLGPFYITSAIYNQHLDKIILGTNSSTILSVSFKIPHDQKEADKHSTNSHKHRSHPLEWWKILFIVIGGLVSLGLIGYGIKKFKYGYSSSILDKMIIVNDKAYSDNPPTRPPSINYILKDGEKYEL
ncbi:hypothetical protein CYY_000554 [Polysphondylium violaceum]|uniref:Uncharacterized protein n=1 Tax=Polysphondylium violaceum TaxID=133409 RepID=A0A8J4Q2M9_9MYCE|nr:hypothetical protein CYY_000554 [Polysphondylium violaceum]